MSINTITREDTFNDFIPGSHIDKVKALSDAKNDTDHLTFAKAKRDNGRNGKYAKLVRGFKDNIAIPEVDSAAYFDDLMSGGH